jgi:sulfur carrier protein
MAIEAYGIRPPFAAALNMNFVPKAHYASTRLQDADQIELITPITGG